MWPCSTTPGIPGGPTELLRAVRLPATPELVPYDFDNEAMAEYAAKLGYEPDKLAVIPTGQSLRRWIRGTPPVAPWEQARE